MHIKKQKGDIGLTMAIAEFTKANFHVSLPIAEHLKYDLIVEKNDILCRVQVRYTSKKGGVVPIKLASAWSNSKGCHSVKREIDDFDILVCYCPDTDKCYFVANKEFDARRTLTLRIDNSLISNLSIREAKKYESCDRSFEYWIKLRDEGEDNSIKKQIINVDEILRLKKEKTWQEIGEMYGVSSVTMSNYMKKQGVDVSSLSIRRNVLSKFDCNSEKSIKVKNLLSQNKSQRQISKDTGYTRYEVTYIINSLKKIGAMAESG